MLFALSMTILYIAFWFALHFGIGTLIPALPEKFRRKWFDFRKPFFRVSSREMNFFSQNTASQMERPPAAEQPWFRQAPPTTENRCRLFK